MILFLMKDRPRQHRWVSETEAKIIDGGVLAKTDEVPKAETKAGFLGNYRFWLATLCWGFNNIYFWGWSTWMPTYFQTVRHFSFKSAGYIYSLSWIFMLAATLLVGYFSDRLMRRGPFAGFGYLLAGSLIFVGGSIVTDAYWAVVVLVIAGCFQGIGYSMLQALFHSIVPERSMASALGIAGGVSQLLSAASPALIGFMLGTSGFGIVVVFCAVNLILPGLLILWLAKQGY
jgi:sugar phosphate permease